MTESKNRRNVQVKFRLPVDTHRALGAIASATGQSLSKVIQGAMRKYVAEAKGKA